MGVEEWLLLTGGVLLTLIGFAGLLLPALPGAPVMWIGLVLIAWAEDFAYVGPWMLALLAALASLTYLIDLLAGLVGARRYGASPRALVGAGIGSVVGLFFGLPGILVGPLLGACIGQLMTVRDLRAAGRAGWGATVGLLFGTAVKVAIAFSMIGLFLVVRFL